MDNHVETLEYSKLPDFALQKRLKYIEGKIVEINLEIRDTSAESPEMEGLTGFLERLEKEKEKVEKELEVATNEG